MNEIIKNRLRNKVKYFTNVVEKNRYLNVAKQREIAKNEKRKREKKIKEVYRPIPGAWNHSHGHWPIGKAVDGHSGC